MKIPKCTKTITGSHDFVDTSYKYCWTELIYPHKKLYSQGEKLWIRPQRAIGYKTHCRTNKGEIKCKHCGIVDDRKERL